MTGQFAHFSKLPFILIVLLVIALGACSAETEQILAPSSAQPSAGEGRLSASDAPVEPMPLESISSWAYQIQEISQPGAVEALAASGYDMLVVEPTRTDWSTEDHDFDTKKMVTQLKDSRASDGIHRKLVLAYVNIGQAEDWRWYWKWSKGWRCASLRPRDWPDYILACDPDGWEGDYPVAYWDKHWKDIVLYGNNQGSDPGRDYSSMIDEVLQDGFDGVYLDWVEGFENEQVSAAAQAAGKDPAVEMITLLRELNEYARKRHPGFMIIQQNATALAEGHEELYQIIDGIAQEGVWYGGEAADQWEDPRGYDQPNDPSLTNEYVEMLEEYQNAGLPVFVCEYALVNAGTTYANARKHGYIAYVTRTPLSRLTTTQPPSK